MRAETETEGQKWWGVPQQRNEERGREKGSFYPRPLWVATDDDITGA